MRLAIALGALLLAACTTDTVAAGPKLPAKSASTLKALAAEVSTPSLRDFDQKLVNFGTRSTISDTVSQTRGIGAARRWAESVFRTDSAACGGCLEIITPKDTFSGGRYPKPTEVVDVVAIQKGVSDPDRVILIQGHIDSRNSDPVDGTADAPGANDDASGVSAVLEAARILSKHKFAATIVYAALSGEEQGLSGGQVLSKYARDHGWKIEAVLNNDIVGASEGMDGMVDAKTVRIFSEGVRAVETSAMASARKTNGGEVDSPSRNISRYMAAIAEAYLADFRVRMIYRQDRFGRGGDHRPYQDLGFPAVRVTEGVENYNRQHQTLRTENGVVYGDTIEHVDFDYLANVTRLNVLTIASMASAPATPTDVKVEGAVSPDTTVSWRSAPGAAGYVVSWRDTTSPVWQHSQAVAAGETSVKLKHVIIDDWFFGVSAISADGHASPVVFAGPVGDFAVPVEKAAAR